MGPAPDGYWSIGKTLIAIGGVITVLGCLMMLLGRFPGFRLGRLPGDIAIERDNFRFYFPLATSILLSVVLSVLLWLFRRRG